MNNPFKRSIALAGLCVIVLVTAKNIEKEDYTTALESHNVESAAPSTVVKNKAPQSQPKKTTRSIKVINNMNDDSLVYKHTTGKYKPKQFKLSVNDEQNAQLLDKKQLVKSHEQEVCVENNTMYIEYDYQFIEAFGTYRRGGKRRVEVAVEQTAELVEIDFSFHNKDHITTVKNATIITSYDI